LEDAAAAPAPTTVKLSDALVSGCYGLPEEEFSETNRVGEAFVSLKAGDLAVDFEARDLTGQAYRLSTLLAEKPVLLFLGNYTCPIYQGKIPAIETLAKTSSDGSKTYGDKLHFVHSYGVEAHPKSPDPNPNKGRVWEGPYSSLHQPHTYEERVANAKQLELDPESQLLLIDDLAPGALNNPVWCTYGPAPNAAFLIAQDGIIYAAHDWLDVPSMQGSIDALLEAKGQ
jgi:hypothetical protein